MVGLSISKSYNSCRLHYRGVIRPCRRPYVGDVRKRSISSDKKNKDILNKINLDNIDFKEKIRIFKIKENNIFESPNYVFSIINTFIVILSRSSTFSKAFQF